MEAASAVEAVPAVMAADDAEEVDEGTPKIVEEDLCGFAALVMMLLDQTMLYTSHRVGPLAGDRGVYRTLRPRRLSSGPICP